MRLKSVIISILLISVVCSSAFGYGAATHTYLAHKLGSLYGTLNMCEMYGSVVPDMFNLLFGHPHQDYLWEQTHYEYAKVVNLAWSNYMQAFAYGFVTHNEYNGADYTAHIQSLILAQADGYVHIKRDQIAPLIQPKIEKLLSDTGYENYAPHLASRIADTAVESAIDYLVSRNEDRFVGVRMSMAASIRSPMIPLLLCRAYMWDYKSYSGLSLEQAAGTIYLAEEQFREYMLLYGSILSQYNALDLMAQQGANLAEQILQQEYGLTVTVPAKLMKRCLKIAISAVEDDYSDELAATLDMLRTQS